MFSEEVAVNSLCLIEAETPEGVIQGCGTFIDNKKIITAKHILKNATRLSIRNSQGEIINLPNFITVKSQYHNQNPDVAIIILRRIFAPAVLPLASRATTADDKLHLITAEAETASRDAVFNQEITRNIVKHLTEQKLSYSALFNTTIPTKNGPAGRPVVNDNCEIVSFITYSIPLYEEFGQAHADMWKLNGHEPRPFIPFLGLHPNCLLSARL